MMSGPGHRRDTPLPGQAGASVVYGRQASFGGAFLHVSSLSVGDEITSTTGQGVATYRVTDVRRSGDPVPDDLAAGAGRLTLVSAVGVPFWPSEVVRVDADLVTEAYQTPDRVLTYAALPAEELPMVGQPSNLALVVLALLILTIAAIAFTLSARFWGRWQTWLIALPVAFALGGFAASRVAALLPNLM